MAITVFIAVISAALLHASWNVLVKSSDDKFLSMTAVVLGHLPIAFIVMLYAPIPTVDSWPYLIAGISLHVSYQLFLLYSYKAGDLTQVYPIARGSAPLLVAGISIFFLNVKLSSTEIAAVLSIGVGIITLSLVRQSDGHSNTKAASLAFCTGCFIAAYSLIDGIGARVSGTSLGFYSWLAIGNAVIFALLMAIIKPRVLVNVVIHSKSLFLFGGAASFLAYALVTWAFTQAPIALVTALREISIVFALLIGVVFLKEQLNLAKLLSTAIATLGVVLLKFSKTQ